MAQLQKRLTRRRDLDAACGAAVAEHAERVREVLPDLECEGSFYLWWELPEGITPEILLERLGAVANQIGPDFRSREVEYILRFSESRAYVCPAAFKGFDYVEMIEQESPKAQGKDATYWMVSDVYQVSGMAVPAPLKPILAALPARPGGSARPDDRRRPPCAR